MNSAHVLSPQNSSSKTLCLRLPSYQRSRHHFGIEAGWLHRSYEDQIEKLNNGTQAEDIFLKAFWRRLSIDQEAPGQAAAKVCLGHELNWFSTLRSATLIAASNKYQRICYYVLRDLAGVLPAKKHKSWQRALFRTWKRQLHDWILPGTKDWMRRNNIWDLNSGHILRPPVRRTST